MIWGKALFVASQHLLYILAVKQSRTFILPMHEVPAMTASLNVSCGPLMPPPGEMEGVMDFFSAPFMSANCGYFDRDHACLLLEMNCFTSISHGTTCSLK